MTYRIGHGSRHEKTSNLRITRLLCVCDLYRVIITIGVLIDIIITIDYK